VSEVASVLIDLFLIFLVAKVGGEIFERVKQPPVIGELLAGVLIGPHALGWLGVPREGLVAAFHGDPAAAQEALRLVYHVVAEMGVIILLFYVGLETRVSDLVRVGPRAFLVGVLGIVLPFGLGLGFMTLQPTQQLTDAFTATALVATSVGITARVMRDLGVLDTAEARIILGAAVIDDILAMLLLAIVIAFSSGAGVSPWSLGVLLGQAVAFVVFVILVGRRLVGGTASTSSACGSRTPPSPWPSCSPWVWRRSRAPLAWPRSSGRSWRGWSWPRRASNTSSSARCCRCTSSWRRTSSS
jgi:Kef-type K+ transport system membrane component KefB